MKLFIYEFIMLLSYEAWTSGCANFNLKRHPPACLNTVSASCAQTLTKTKKKIETSLNRGSNAEYQRNLHQCKSNGTVLGKQLIILWKDKAFFLKRKSTALFTIKWQRLKDWKLKYIPTSNLSEKLRNKRKSKIFRENANKKIRGGTFMFWQFGRCCC